MALAAFVLASPAAGAEDMSSCFEQPIKIADTAATKKIIFFIPYSLYVAASCGDLKMNASPDCHNPLTAPVSGEGFAEVLPRPPALDSV